MTDKDNSKYVEIYNEKDYARDEKSFSDAEKSGNINKVDWSAFSRLMLNDLCCNTSVIEDGCIGHVRLEDVHFALKHPKRQWKILMQASEQLMRVSPHYYRLNTLYTNMALFCWWIDLYGVKENANKETIKKVYTKLADKFEDMNIKHEFGKIMQYIPYQDIYCGLVVEDDNNFFFQKVDFDICKLHRIDDGLFNFKIDLSKLNPKTVKGYPDYIKEAYFDFIGKHVDDKDREVKIKNNPDRWYEPSPDLQICIKLNSQWIHPFPILINLVRDILDLDTYKKLKLQSARTDNYKAIAVKVPIDESTVDKPLISPEFLGMFAEINRESMNDDIGLIHTLGSDGEPISFKDSTNTTNNVSDGIDEVYNSSGVTQQLFNGASSSTAITLSVENDAGVIYKLYRQFERWANRYIKNRKFNKSSYKFKFSLEDITIFNRDNVSKRYKEACTLGAPVVNKWLATLDLTPSITLGSFIMHKDIFDFQNNLIPLSSSYNGVAAGTSEVGRPSNSEKGELLSEEGEKTADNDRNVR